MPRLTTSVLGSIALVLGLVACSPATTETPPVDTAVQTDAPAPPDGAADVVIPDGVIGTAELTSASEDNTVSGTVVVTAGGGGFDVALEDFRSDVPGGIQLFFSPWSETTTRLADMYNFSFGNLATDADQHGLSLGGRGFSRGDPSYYLTAVITATAPSATDPDGCVLTPRAVGTITWDVPATRPGLLAVDTAPGWALAAPRPQSMVPPCPTARLPATRSTTSPTASASRSTTSASSTRSPAASSRPATT